MYFINRKASVFNNIHVLKLQMKNDFWPFRVWRFLSLQNQFPTLANSLTDSAFPDSSVGSRARLSLYPSFKSSGKFSAISANDLRAFCTLIYKILLLTLLYYLNEQTALMQEIFFIRFLLQMSLSIENHLNHLFKTLIFIDTYKRKFYSAIWLNMPFFKLFHEFGLSSISFLLLQSL